MSAAHTPGPWNAVAKYSTSTELLGVEGPNGHICTLEDYDEAAADAVLIAAAPDLLAALEAIAEGTQGFGGMVGQHGKIAREAIAKAKGAA